MTPEQYYQAIKDLRTPEEIQAVCDQLTKDLFNETDKQKTRINKLTPYSKFFKDIPNEELIEGENAYIQTRSDGSYWKRHLHFKFTGVADTNFNGKGGINTKTVVLDRLENQQEIPVNDYLETTTRLLQSNDAHELAVGLIAASGRRPIEILARGSFTHPEKLPKYLKPEYFLNFKGQAKKREYDTPEDERTEYRIGVLVPAQSFLSAFEKFRSMPESKELMEFLKTETEKGTEPEQINAHIDDRRGNSLRRVVQREFLTLPKRQKDTELNPKALRAVYVNLITERDCPKNINRLLWASRAIGHFVDNSNVSDRDLMHLVTTLGYSDYYIDSPVPFTPEIEITPIAPVQPEKTQETKETKKMSPVSVRVDVDTLETIKQWQTELNLPSQQSVIEWLVKERLELLAKKKERPTIDVENLSDDEIKRKRGEEVVNEKIRRAFEAITNYNDKQPSNAERWYIGNQTLRTVSGCNGLAVAKWIKNYQTSVDDANNKYDLGQYHNKIHSRKDLSELVK